MTVADARSQKEKDEARRVALANGAALEKRGLVDPAVQAYLGGGAVEEAARLLVGLRRFADAGAAILSSFGVSPEEVGTLDAAGKKLALQAAICFSRAGDTPLAVRLLVSLGERERAADLLRKAGDPIAAAKVLVPVAKPGANVFAQQAQVQQQAVQRGLTLAAAQALEQQGKFGLALDAYLALRQMGHAGRMAQRLGRASQAGDLFTTAGQPYEAAQAFFEANEPARALDALQRVSRDDPNYRPAAVQAIRIASDLGALDFQLEHFLTRFFSEPARNERELEALYLAGKLYQKHDFIENAKDAWRKVLAINPNYRDTRARLDGLEQETRGSAMVYEKILREDAAFRGPGRGAPPPSMMDLPDLPGLPTIGASGAWSDLGPVDGEAGTMTSVPPQMKLPPPPPRPTSPIRSSPIAPRPPAAAGTPPPIYPAAAPWTAPPAYPVAPPATPSVNQPPPRPSMPAPMQASVPGPTIPPTPPAPVAKTPPAPPKLAPGEIIADRYRLVKKIGQGGMAAVFKADDLELGETVALKVFTKLVEDAQMIARFKQELTLSRQLNHPNIIRLYDIGTVAGFKYITMELLAGDDLKVKLGKPISIDVGIQWLIQACAALQHAHEKGVIHRDIKPANLFLTNDGVVKLMDFGIAKRQATPGLTVAGMIAGTPEYMSPEQINGFDKVTASTDVYALGIMAYEIFTGSVPFRHPELMPLLVMQMTEPPPPPRAKNPAIPVELERIILKLLEKDAANRFQSCRDVGVALAGVRTK